MLPGSSEWWVPPGPASQLRWDSVGAVRVRGQSLRVTRPWYPCCPDPTMVRPAGDGALRFRTPQGLEFAGRRLGISRSTPYRLVDSPDDP